MWKINLKPEQKIWFTSDTHYNHANICRGTTKWTGNLDMHTRNFKSLPDMNNQIVHNLNFMVAQDDILIHLGDWSLGGFDSIREFRERIHCKNIYLVLGNHDHHIEDNKDNIRDLFVDVVHYTRLEVIDGDDKYEFVLSHFPIASWHGMNKSVMHLFGHVHLPHGKKIMPGKSMDIGVDGFKIFPYSLFQVVHSLKMRPNKTTLIPSDHHETEIR